MERLLSHGGEHTGWSRAWIINFWARLGCGEKTYEHVLALLTKSALRNLFDDHPPLQIDGNFGGTAGIAEMLLHSHTGEVHLLPALPAAWLEGAVRGIRVRGGFELDMTRKASRLQKVTLISTKDNHCKLLYLDKVIDLKTQAGQSYILTAEQFEK